MDYGHEVKREERAIYLTIIIALAPVVIAALARQVDFDGGTTICLMGAVLGVIGLVASVIGVRRKPLLPKVRLRRWR